MIDIVLVLLLAGTLFFLEIILPGGILGVLGGILLLVATGFAYQNYGFLGAVLVFLFGVAFVTAFLFFQFRVLPKTKLGRNAFLQTKSEGTSNLKVGDDSIAGKVGTTVSRLNPSGTVLVDGVRHQAMSQSGFIQEGEAVQVVSKDAFRLLVRKK